MSRTDIGGQFDGFAPIIIAAIYKRTETIPVILRTNDIGAVAWVNVKLIGCPCSGVVAVTRRALSDGDRHLGTVEARSRPSCKCPALACRVVQRNVAAGRSISGGVGRCHRATVQIIADGKTIAGSNGGGAVVKRSVILANGEAVTWERSAVQAVGHNCLRVVVAQRDRAIMEYLVQERTSVARQDADTLSKTQLADLGAIRNNNTRIGIVLRIGSIETVRAGEGTEST